MIQFNIVDKSNKELIFQIKDPICIKVSSNNKNVKFIEFTWLGGFRSAPIFSITKIKYGKTLAHELPVINENTILEVFNHHTED